MFESDRHEFLSPANWELDGQDQDTFLPLDVNKIPCKSYDLLASLNWGWLQNAPGTVRNKMFLSILPLTIRYT